MRGADPGLSRIRLSHSLGRSFLKVGTLDYQTASVDNDPCIHASLVRRDSFHDIPCDGILSHRVASLSWSRGRGGGLGHFDGGFDLDVRHDGVSDEAPLVRVMRQRERLRHVSAAFDGDTRSQGNP